MIEIMSRVAVDAGASPFEETTVPPSERVGRVEGFRGPDHSRFTRVEGEFAFLRSREDRLRTTI